MKIIKRNGQSIVFEEEKIVNAIKKAMSETEKGVDSSLAFKIAKDIKSDFQDSKESPSVEKVQDMVEELLATNGRFDASKKYILYRRERARLREQGWEMSELQEDIYEKKYKLNNESFSEFLTRVSGDNRFIQKAIRDKKFMPAGRILAGRGLPSLGKKITYSNCYVLPKIEDNIENIFDTAKHMARTYSYGGGVGVSISKLRPKGAKVNNAANTTTGATSFMSLYSMVTELIGMRGRRGALMINLDVSHPDIEEFVDIKNDLSQINTANISVNIDDEFMEAVRGDKEYELYFYVDATGEEVKKKINARDLFEKIAKNNWRMAEPGMLYTDRINSWHLMSEDPDFEFAGVNPCAEETLPAFGSCNLSSINLSMFVKNPFTDQAEFDFEEFGRMVREGVVYLNEVLEENIDLHPLEQQKKVSKEYRQIGLGIMGLADCFIKLKVRYGSKESIELIHKIGKLMVNEALKQSALLAKEHGAFPRYKEEAILKSPFLLANATDKTLKLIKKYGLRNSQLLTIPPTGSISTLIGCSSGMEPIFQISYTRKSESLYDEDTYYEVFTPIVKEYMEKNNIAKKEELPDFFVTTSSLNYKERLDVQAAWQQYIDASISSTVNVPNEFTIKEVEELYMYAWERGLKGVTIYRDGCERAGVLTTNKKESKTEKIQKLQEEMDKLIVDQLLKDPDKCPMCGGKMMHTGRCDECQDCGYSLCSI